MGADLSYPMEKSRKSGAKPKSRRKAAASKSATGKSTTNRRPGSRKTTSKPQRKIVRTVLKGLSRAASFLLYWGAIAAVWGGVVGGCLLAFYAYDLPDVDAAFSATRRPSVTVLAADGSELASIGDMYGMPVRLQDLPPALPQAIIATEDRRFYSHFGLDVIGLARAAWVNFQAGRIRQGGSTLTQQVAKNLFLTPERTIKRKVQEVLIALWLEHKFSKDEILTVYMNRVYLGAGAWGVDAAARKFFGRSASQVSTWQAAMIAGLMKAPSRLNPISSKERAEARTNIVLSNMVAAGCLTAESAALARQDKDRNVRSAAGAGSRYFVDWVLEQVPDYITLDRDVIVRTTFDPVIQRGADAAVVAALDGAGQNQNVSQAAVVVMTPDGAVRAMVGGRSYGTSQYNRATRARRQPGSAFKPFVYLAGLESGLLPDTVMVDGPVDINGWMPKNFDNQYHGSMTLNEAMIRSSNTIAVKVASHAGWRNVVRVAERLGLTGSPEPNPSIALGTHEVSLLEITGAYAPFANQGMGVWPYAIKDIRDRNGTVLYARTGTGPGRVLAQRHAAAMNTMLSGVIEDGTGRNAGIERPAAGKTGTSQNFRDGWFVGYTANLVAGVWMGNDNGAAPKRLTGGGLPAKIWHDTMMAAHLHVPVSPLDTQIPDLQQQGDNLFSGLLSSLLSDGG